MCELSTGCARGYHGRVMELIEKQVLYAGRKCKFELHHFMHDGKRVVRELVNHPGAVVVLALTDAGEVILIRNRRFAVGEVLWEVPAGTLEPGEPPLNAAGRELLEETGYLAKKLRPLCTFYPSPGVMSEKMHVFVATELVARKQALEEGEEIEVAIVPMKRAMEMIQSGQIHDGKTMTALLFYERFGVPDFKAIDEA
jgi:ADP-ribose pyrophosphatase